MKLFIRTVFFHFLCIIIFGFLYHNVQHDFKRNIKESYTILDYLSLSTTIQSGVGFSDMYPTTFYSKLLLIIQQFIMILTHVLTIYIFTL